MNSKIKKYDDNIKHTQDELAVAYLPAVKAMAYRLKERLPAFIDTLDLVSIGVEELVKLARRYDKNLNDSFWGYSKKRVYGSMLDYLRSLDIVSRSNRKLIKSINEEIQKYLNNNDEEPTDEFLAKALEESVDKIREARVAVNIYALMPLNEQMTLFEEEDTLDIIERDELVGKIQDILECLSEREQLIIQLYYFEELNLKEISDILDITQSRISQIHKAVIKKIKERIKNNG
jgi:RNA polymerase sigma factor for flagellar operon FliA